MTHTHTYLHKRLLGFDCRGLPIYHEEPKTLKINYAVNDNLTAMVKNAEQAIENYPRSIVKKKVKDVL
jgi:hypothetical protein